MNDSAKIVVHPNSRYAYAAERLRKAAVIEDSVERQRFLMEAVEKYRVWSTDLGVLPHRVL
jgi:hypothetical protein